MDDFEIKQSEFVKKLMWKVMKFAGNVEQGFLFFRNRIVSKVHFDEKECRELLVDMIINEANVLRYLKRKYIPTWVEDGAIFKDQKCIQRAVIKDGYLFIHIAKSEPHKIITDTMHVRNLMIEHGLNPPLNIKFRIDQVQIAYQDTLLYNLLLKEFGMSVPAASRIYEKQLLAKYQKLENVAKIKKRSVKRKFMRYWAKKGQIEWSDLRQVINIEDFSPNNIRSVCNEIRERNKAKGIKIEY